MTWLSFICLIWCASCFCHAFLFLSPFFSFLDGAVDVCLLLRSLLFILFHSMIINDLMVSYTMTILKHNPILDHRVSDTVYPQDRRHWHGHGMGSRLSNSLWGILFLLSCEGLHSLFMFLLISFLCFPFLVSFCFVLFSGVMRVSLPHFPSVSRLCLSVFQSFNWSFGLNFGRSFVWFKFGSSFTLFTFSSENTKMDSARQLICRLMTLG
jgi:hypothetical protein